MSLTALPTELEMQIIEHLHDPEDRKALSSLLRVSKYWRAICEPVLYRNLTLRAPGEAQIKRLLMTLLDTPGLAKHIKTVAFHATETESYFDNRTWLEEREKSILALWSHAGSIQEEIGSRSGYMSAEYMVTWFGSIFAREGQDRARRPSVDGSLALILAMAVNIEAIDLHLTEVEPLALLCELLCFRWHEPPAGPSTQAFGQLEGLKLYGGHIMVQGILARMDPCVKRLHIYDCPLAGAVTHAIENSTQLSVLELANVEISSSTMESMLKDPALCSLREIKLTMLTSPDESWESYDFSALSAILVAQFPDLQAFECTHPGRGDFEMGFSRPFGSFKQLTKLHTLRLDLDLLLDDGRYDLFDHDTMLPSSLGHLSLTENAYVLDNLLKVSNDKHDDEAVYMVWKFITNPAPGISLETFTLEIYTDEDDRDTSLPEDQRSVQPDHAMCQRLRDLARDAAKRGLAYNAIEYEVDFEQRYKRWVGVIAGCTSAREEDT